MRLLFFLFSFLAIQLTYSQTGTEALFKTGTELEYKTTMANPGGGNLREISRITLIVRNVTDSNNATYSYITKKVRSAKMPETGYDKNYVIHKTVDKVYLPQDLYSADTVYLADVEGIKGKNGRRAYATAEFKQQTFMALAVDFTKGKMDFEPTSYSIEGKVLQYDVNHMSSTHGYWIQKKWEIKTNVKKVSVGGKTKTKTEAGEFDCYKITAKMEVIIADMPIEFESTSYYSEKYGMIKTDPVEKAVNGGFELVRIKE